MKVESSWVRFPIARKNLLRIFWQLVSSFKFTIMYKYHCENIEEIEGAIRLVELDLRRYISIQQEKHSYKYTKLLSYLITCWTEVRILKLAYEKNGFSQYERDIIISAGTLNDKWITALDIAICKAYGINKNLDIATQLQFTARVRYNELKNLISSDLLPSIEIRNRIAHGQWKIAFTNNLRNTSSPLTGQLRLENIVLLQLKKKLLIGLSSLIHDLAVSPLTFERDFDKNYKLIEQNKRNLHKRDFCLYKQKMIDKYQRGIVKRNEATS